MKRIILALAISALALPATALAKGPSEASITGPGLGNAIKISGPEDEGSPMMRFADQAGFFAAAFGQQPSPLLPGRPKGDLGPKYRIAYTVPGPDNKTFHIKQELYPYARPYAVTYLAGGQPIFDSHTQGGWSSSPLLKDTLVAAGLPKTAAAARDAASSSSAGFFSTGRLGLLVLVLLVLGAATVAMRRRAQRPPAA